MKTFFEYLEAMRALFTFTPYTTLPRWLEIGYGILAWAHLVGIVTAAWLQTHT